MSDAFKIDEQAEAEKLARLSPPYVTLFERDALSVGLYAPRGTDTQTPHDRDEFYIVSSGSARFHCDSNVGRLNGGDFLFVPAGSEHGFEDFSSDFRAWVVFFGPYA